MNLRFRHWARVMALMAVVDVLLVVAIWKAVKS